MDKVESRRLALICLVSERRGIRRLGKTAMQKFAYFAQDAFDVPLGYKFSLYTYGPYASELMSDIDFFKSLGFLSVDYDERRGFNITPVNPPARAALLPDEEQRISAMLDVLGDYSARDLELAATLCYISRSQSSRRKEDVVRGLLSIKPHFSPDEVSEMYDRLSAADIVIR